jgi:hypothetical protein
VPPQPSRRFAGTPHEPSRGVQHSPRPDNRVGHRRRADEAAVPRRCWPTLRLPTHPPAPQTAAADKPNRSGAHPTATPRSFDASFRPGRPTHLARRRRPIPIAAALDPRLRSIRLLSDPAPGSRPMPLLAVRDRTEPSFIPTMSAGRSDLMSATCSDRSRPAVPIDVGRGGASPVGRV